MIGQIRQHPGQRRGGDQQVDQVTRAAEGSAGPVALFGTEQLSALASQRVKLPVTTAPDDVMLVADAGAYGRSMSNEYNLRALPAEDVLE